MKSNNTLTFAQKLKIVPLLQANTEPDGGDRVRYTNGQNDDTLAAMASEAIGRPVTAFNIAVIRRQVIGKFRTGGPVPGAGRKGLAPEVAALRADVADLRAAVGELGKIVMRRQPTAYIGNNGARVSA
jgi:hypothetical protein